MSTTAQARLFDPATSHEAAASMTGPVLRDQQASVLQIAALKDSPAYWYDEHERGVTAYEIADHLDGKIQQNVAAKRLGELEAMGYVARTTHTRRGSSRARLIVWCVTDAGREAVRP